VRARYKLTMPAAGKTGTSHDGWFAGYTSELLCVVWVGFDDNRELDLEGAHSAAPIWAEFMKHAVDYREYRDTKPFHAPAGIVSISIDPESGMPATPNCPKTRTEVYIAGTEPVGICPLHGGRGGITNVAGWDTGPPPSASQPAHTAPTITGSPGDGEVPADSAARRAARQASGQAAATAAPPPAPQKDETKKEPKKGFFQRLLRVFK
jgi:penicillin-binding protein 1B